MAKNDFKAFSTAGGANTLTQAEYEALAALSTGWQSGKASSKEVNKVLRQATFIAAAIAQFVADKSGQDVLDDGNLAGFSAKLLLALNAQSQPLDATLTALAGLATGANQLAYFTGADTVSQTNLTQVGRDIIGKNDIGTVLQYLQLGEAAKRDVGTGANQIPDMNSFLCSLASNGYMKFPGGLIVQWANAGPLVGNSSALLSFPIPFPNQLLVAVPYTGSTVAAQNLGVSIKYETRQSITLFASTTSTSTSCGAISIGY